MFYLAWHLHWSRGEIMDLDPAERHQYVRMVAERVVAQHDDPARRR